MNFDKLIKSTLNNIVKKRNQIKAVTKFQNFIDENGWPLAVTKQSIYKAIDILISSKLPPSEGNLLDLLLYGEERTLPKMTEYQKEMLERLRDIVKTAKKCVCNHELKITSFYHGGGFSGMMYAYPELICEKCGLNVTVGASKIEQLKPIGLSTTQKQLDRLNVWANKCFKDRKIKVLSANEITKDPFKALKESEVWPNKFPFKIINMETFELRSGH